MSLGQFIEQLDREWELDGFLGRVGVGQFAEEEAEHFLKLLRGLHVEENALVPKRLLSLLWYLPIFLIWQRERVALAGGDAA